MIQRIILACLLGISGALTPATSACAQASTGIRGTVVLAIPADVSVPVPVVGLPYTHVADVTDQLFLRLGFLKSSFRTVGDEALTPMLARSWRRVDSLTLAFELDPRATWHDGAPVTTHDVMFTWRLMVNPAVGTDHTVIEPIAGIDSTGARTFRVRFRRTFAEQLYLIGFNLQPLPAHLLERIAVDSITTSGYAAQPVGNGPFRFERRVPGEFVELRANSAFFLGTPTIGRVVFRVIPDPAARLNLLLSGELDVLEYVPPTAMPQVRAKRDLRVVTFMSNLVLYGRFNTRAADDTARAHPVLGDRAVREALVSALDRGVMAQRIYGRNASVPGAVQSVSWSWIRPVRGTAGAASRAKVRAALANAGWRDRDGDGILDRNGVPLRVGILYPQTSAVRNDFALQMQAMWRAVGIDAHLERLPGPVVAERLNAGRFDVEMGSVNQDASPMSLTQSWSCASAREARSSNKARWCNPEFDRLLANAMIDKDPVPGYRAALAHMARETPAAFLAAPYNNIALHSRFENVQVWPVKSWTSLWQWRVRRGAELPRDR
ncbi:MAG: ABC transporter substrate-binding protein [Gemmatimonadales bacterium]